MEDTKFRHPIPSSFGDCIISHPACGTRRILPAVYRGDLGKPVGKTHRISKEKIPLSLPLASERKKGREINTGKDRNKWVNPALSPAGKVFLQNTKEIALIRLFFPEYML
jgi:hypothetical protein